MSGKGIRISSAMCFYGIVILGLYYYSYRYIFKWANDITSGSYTNTPMIVQVAKYMICAVMLVIALFFGIDTHIRRDQLKNLVILLAFQWVWSLYIFLNIRDSRTLIMLMGISITLVMCLVRPELKFDVLDSIFRIFIIYTFIYELVQIVLYISIGRLPAIAWANAGIMQVRFGGAFDDPLVFSIFCAFLIPYVAHRFRGYRRIFYIGSFLVFLMLTWTLTSIVTLLGVYCMSKVLSVLRKKRVHRQILLVSILFGAVFFVFLLFYGRDFIIALYNAKKGSIQAHLQSSSVSDVSVFLTLIRIIPEGKQAESTLTRMIYTGGLLYLMMFYILGIRSSLKLYKYQKYAQKDSKQKNPIILGMFYYQICFMVASLNLPFPYMFLSMLIYSLFVGISFCLKIPVMQENLEWENES